MSVSIIVGGQFGSEGKGKVSKWYADKSNASVAIRVGGCNSGHTVIDKQGCPVIFRTLPTPSLDGRVVSVLPAGSYIDLESFRAEIAVPGVDPSKIMIHPHATIVVEEDRQAERDLVRQIASTGSGTGAALSKRVLRDPRVLLAKDIAELRPFLAVDLPSFLRRELDAGREIVIEGTQGFGLSNLHSPYYPKATARDTTSAGFLMEAGLSPLDVRNIILVIRSFPIRVPGDSGPLPREVDWDTVTAEARSAKPIQEYTSVTNGVRRVARFDDGIVRGAIVANTPNMIVLNHLDYISEAGTRRARFVDDVERSIGQKIDYVGLGPEMLQAWPGVEKAEPLSTAV